MPRKQASKPTSKTEKLQAASVKQSLEADEFFGAAKSAEDEATPKKNGGWREIEARREKAALKASLADVWDEDFDLDEEILAELDHTAEYFTQQSDEEEEEVFLDDDDDADEYYDDDDES